MVLVGDLQNLLGLISLNKRSRHYSQSKGIERETNQPVGMQDNTLLRLLDVLLAAGDLRADEGPHTHGAAPTRTLTLTFWPAGIFFFLAASLSLSSWSSEKSTLTPSESRILLTPAPWAPTMRATNSRPISNSVDWADAAASSAIRRMQMRIGRADPRSCSRSRRSWRRR